MEITVDKETGDILEIKTLATSFVEQLPEEPKLWNVILLNDPVTPGLWLHKQIMDVFGLSNQVALALVMKAHREGKSVLAKYVRDIAEAKATQLVNLARNEGYPLQCTSEED